MRQTTFLMLLVLIIDQCLSQKGFPKQFQATLNISGIAAWDSPALGVKQLLYDYEKLRIRFDIQGWRHKQNETYLLQYKPEGAGAGSPASQGYAIFDFNPDFPDGTKNDCWYRTNSMIDVGPFPISWLHGVENYIEIEPWFPLPSNLINKGEEYIPEIKQNATRYDSPEICDLQHSRIGKVPCLSYFEIQDRPVKTIQARPSPPDSFDNDEYITTIYLSFTNGIPSEAEHLFNLPNQWPAYCGNANTGFSIDPLHNFVVTPNDQDHFILKLQTPPLHSLGDQVKVEFKVQPSGYYNGTRCARFNPIVFDRENWQKPQQVNMTFIDYGCCIYALNATGGGYEWQYGTESIMVFACDERVGSLCKGEHSCDF